MDARPIHPWPVRLAHWVGVTSVVIMGGSGLQILGAFPFLGPRGMPVSWYPLQGWRPPSPLRIGGWLGGARAWHFTTAWPLVGVAVVYVVFLVASGQWRTRLFLPKRDARHALATLRGYLHLGPMPQPIPFETGAYNGLQRAAYTVALALCALEVLSGLVLWKPVQLEALGSLMGGYDGARAIHLLGLAAIAAFALGHVLMVVTHPKTLFEMLGGGTRVSLRSFSPQLGSVEEKAPEPDPMTAPAARRDLPAANAAPPPSTEHGPGTPSLPISLGERGTGGEVSRRSAAQGSTRPEGDVSEPHDG